LQELEVLEYFFYDAFVAQHLLKHNQTEPISTVSAFEALSATLLKVSGSVPSPET